MGKKISMFVFFVRDQIIEHQVQIPALCVLLGNTSLNTIKQTPGSNPNSWCLVAYQVIEHPLNIHQNPWLYLNHLKKTVFCWTKSPCWVGEIPHFSRLKSTRPKIVASCAASVPEDGGFDKATLRQSLPWKPHGTFPPKNGETRRFDHEKWRFNLGFKQRNLCILWDQPAMR